MRGAGLPSGVEYVALGFVLGPQALDLVGGDRTRRRSSRWCRSRSGGSRSPSASTSASRGEKRVRVGSLVLGIVRRAPHRRRRRAPRRGSRPRAAPRRGDGDAAAARRRRRRRGLLGDDAPRRPLGRRPLRRAGAARRRLERDRPRRRPLAPPRRGASSSRSSRRATSACGSRCATGPRSPSASACCSGAARRCSCAARCRSRTPGRVLFGVSLIAIGVAARLGLSTLTASFFMGLAVSALSTPRHRAARDGRAHRAPGALAGAPPRGRTLDFRADAGAPVDRRGRDRRALRSRRSSSAGCSSSAVAARRARRAPRRAVAHVVRRPRDVHRPGVRAALPGPGRRHVSSSSPRSRRRSASSSGRRGCGAPSSAAGEIREGTGRTPALPRAAPA